MNLLPQYEIRAVFLDGTQAHSFSMTDQAAGLGQSIYGREPDKWGIYERVEDNCQKWLQDFDSYAIAQMAFITLTRG